MKKHTTSSVWRRVYPLMRPYLGTVVWLNLITVLQAAAQIALAVITKYVIDAAVHGSGSFWSWAGGLVLVLLLIVALHAVASWCAGSATDRCVAGMRQALLGAAAASSGSRLQAFHSGALLSRCMEDVHTLCDGVVIALPSAVGQLARLIGAFAAIIALYPALAPWLLLASVLIIGGSAALRPIMARQHRQVRNADEQVMSSLQENLQQLELVQSLQMEDAAQARFGSRIRQSLRARHQRRAWSVSINTLLSLVSQVGSGGLLLWCALQVANKTMTYGGLSAILQLLAILRAPVVGLSGLWTRFAAVSIAAQRLQDILEESEPASAPVQPKQVKAVVFEDVSFSYPGDETAVLTHFSAAFPLEDWAVLTGISGKGKSTIFKLILGLYAPHQGRVYLDTDLGQLPCSAATRHLFAYVPQDYSLFSGTVEENLLLAAPRSAPQARTAALEAAQADFIFSLPAGVHTTLREHNAGLSKGQLQRIAIARAILMDRPILLLDECSSALDAQTEEALLRSLKALGKQAILVTHRPDALAPIPGVTLIPIDQS